MAVPDFQSFFLPLLQYSSDGELHNAKEAYEAMADHFRLSQEAQQEMLPELDKGVESLKARCFLIAIYETSVEYA